jgi:hypothetical protein
MDRLRPKLDKDDVLLADEKPAPRKPGG